MRVYTIQHTCACGIDRPVDWLSRCVLDAEGAVGVPNNMRPTPNALRQALQPFREAVVVGVECLFPWDLAC